MSRFVEIKGKGHINVNNVVMVSNKMTNGKYMLTLVHGGKIQVTKGVRDKIVRAQFVGKSPSMTIIDEDAFKDEVESDE
jgi:hypothetical protein